MFMCYVNTHPRTVPFWHKSVRHQHTHKTSECQVTDQSNVRKNRNSRLRYKVWTLHSQPPVQSYMGLPLALHWLPHLEATHECLIDVHHVSVVVKLAVVVRSAENVMSCLFAKNSQPSSTTRCARHTKSTSCFCKSSLLRRIRRRMRRCACQRVP